MTSDQNDQNPTTIYTDGGPAISGPVNTGGGDFVARDKIIQTEEIAYTVDGLKNPYLGLRAFGYEQRSIYGGREQLAQEVVDQLTDPTAPQTLLFINGASGSGKSSFVQAGLLPLLERHYADQQTVRHAIVRPSTRPLVIVSYKLRSQDERKILTSSADGTVRVWYTYMNDLLVAAYQWSPRNFTWSEWRMYMAENIGTYRPTCPNAPIPPDVIESIQDEARQLIRAGQLESVTQRLEELNGWLQVNGQFKSFGVDLEAFVAEVSATATPVSP